MSAFTPEYLIERNRANVATLFTLADQAFDGFRQLVEPGHSQSGGRAERETVSGDPVQHDVRAWLTRHTSRFQPVSEQALSYAGHFCDIVRDTHSKWVEAAQTQYRAKDRYNSKS
ncbi:phasin family protein [Paraburkholderia hospita]|uniref:Phasin family protein n=1 Tax=Paraburkholderia hospita TaxID=169430 RepID=A0ABN0F5L4_9BURK|nr:phasin family protein [Paraburkholderia hospita]EIM93882.1 phasin family protein [Paraburkholderia hospita]OUL80612.1 hypothetical protein CA602_27750 [Paraburkholderia hospita]